jgi:hypothetical protein
MRVAFVERWRLYVVWLGSGLSGILPDELRMTFGPVWAMLPLARQVAQALGPWLAALLAERQRQGLVAQVGGDGLWLSCTLEKETRSRRLDRRSACWLKWLLVAELRRLVCLAEASEETMRRPGWLAWEVRYWALAACLARIGQLYAALQRKQQPEQAQRLFKGALALVWHQALRATTPGE